jgi:hypothetical protein
VQAHAQATAIFRRHVPDSEEATMDLSRLRTGEKIAAGAALLLFVDLFLKWYGVNLGEAFGQVANTIDVDTSVSAWQAFDFTDILLFLIVVVTVGLVALQASGSTLRPPVSRSAIITLLGALATVWVLWRLINEPGPNKLIDIKIGAYLGLLFAAGIAFGGWRAMQDEGVSLGDAKAQAQAAVGGHPAPTTRPATGDPVPAPTPPTPPEATPPEPPPSS